MNITDKIPDKNPFKVPENYFNEVNQKIIAATSGANHAKSFRIIPENLKSYLMVAASVAGLVILTLTALKFLSTDEQKMQLSDVILYNNSEIIMDEFDLYTLEESAASVMIFEDLPEVDNSDIIDYLILEDIDINDIYEQL